MLDFCVRVQDTTLILGIFGGLTWNLLLSIGFGTAGRSKREDKGWVRQGEDWEPETDFFIIYIFLLFILFLLFIFLVFCFIIYNIIYVFLEAALRRGHL